VSLAPPKPSPLVPGYRLDRYELLCPIAQGGMAEVWVARLRGKHGFEKLVAIKTILPQFAQDTSFQRMFLDEAHIASGIEHPNVAQILDLGEEHDVLYLVMEWVDGDALSKLQRAVAKKKTTIPLGVTLRILADTCGGLHAAHELHDKEGRNLGVVHRDVSPQNILLSNKGLAKLIDFGIAKARGRIGGDTSSGTFKGKIHYMAPEQALGKPVDRRADVWAIGAILHHLVAGRPPFDAENQLAALHLLASGRPPPPLPKSVPSSIADVVRRTLKHDPDKRIATAAELQKAIEGAMADAWINTSTADVAAFLDAQLADRAENRRKAVELALKAAAERAKMIELLTPPPSQDLSSSSGNTLAEGKRPKPPVPADQIPKEDSGDVAIELPNLEPLPTLRPISETSAATTLGSTAAPIEPIEPSSAVPKPRRTLVLGVVSAAALLLVVAAGFTLRNRSNSSNERKAETSENARPTVPDQPSSSASSTQATKPEEPVVASAPVPSTSQKPEPVAMPLKIKLPATATTTKPTATAVVVKKKIDDGF